MYVCMQTYVYTHTYVCVSHTISLTSIDNRHPLLAYILYVYRLTFIDNIILVGDIQCCSCHATRQKGVLPGRSNRQQSCWAGQHETPADAVAYSLGR